MLGGHESLPGGPVNAAGPRERAEEFLAKAGEFRLGGLTTELPHPKTTELSQVAAASAAEGLALLFDVDGDVVARYSEWAGSDQPARMAAATVEAIRRGKRIFFTGCGATGRLSVQLDSIWRAFWQQRRARALVSPSPDCYENRSRSAMAGGDYALIKSVEGFEDFAAFGRKQVADLGIAEGDVLFAITEGGETSFVIGTAWQGLAAGARVFFVYNNPDEILRSLVRRSREVIDEPRIEKVNLTTGPMAITGSTRMQATSIELLAMLTVLEMTLRDLLAEEGALDAAVGASSDVPAEIASDLAALHSTLSGAPFRESLGRMVEIEGAIYAGGWRSSYLADSLAVDVLTDTAERSPTFCIPSFRKWDDAEASESWGFLFTPYARTEQAWAKLLRRAPQTIEWTIDDLRSMLDEEAVERQALVLGEIGLSQLLRFRIGLDGIADRPARPGDAVTAILGPADVPLVEGPDAPFSGILARAKAAGATTAFIAGGGRPALSRFESLARATGVDHTVLLLVPERPALLDPLLRVGMKMLMNAMSTCTMARLGRVLGNRMIWVVPSNLKLIDRSTRYISHLAGVPYSEACHALFEVIDYVEPRRRAGKAYPPPVAMATLRLRHGLGLEEAEARLATTPLDEGTKPKRTEDQGLRTKD
ncbi:MAG: hypothetical protein ACE148_11420 [Vicinamibacterales bacterium]